MTKDEANFSSVKPGAFVGTVGLCMGIAYGTANLLGYSSHSYMRLLSRYMTGSAKSVATWMSNDQPKPSGIKLNV
ncbi:hypothetical protein BDF14DRAFT_1827380 [Spinellus fusiger]|nr:hypothetical protein BDF14DRAFT_1827380 [Spinellus fusiger]